MWLWGWGATFGHPMATRAWLIAHGIDPLLYWVWAGMRARCTNPNHIGYQNYGGRGIKVCRRWDTFAQFAVDVGKCPGKGWTIDRKNNNGNYTPRNFRWATRAQQRQNARHTRLTEAQVRYIRKNYRPKYGAIVAIARKLGVSQGLVNDVTLGRSWQEYGLPELRAS